MDTLWAPWRIGYILGEKDKNCIFCTKSEEKEDDKNFIIKRGEKCFVLLNIFPYNNGHLLITPYRHISDLTELNTDELTEMMHLSQKALTVFKKTLKPAGFNMGINLGKVGGAGIADHIHLHIVPRWDGDTNFMPVVGNTKVIPQHLEEVYRVLKNAWEQDDEKSVL